MEFPYGHHSHTHHHHHHQRNDDDDDGAPPPPPPSQHFHQPPPPYGRENEFSAPPPPFYQDNEFSAPPSRPFYQETEYAPPPPSRPYYQETEYAPPPPTQVTHVHHSSHNQDPDPSLNYPPPTTQVTHVSHESQTETHHSYRPHLPAFIHQHTHQSGVDAGVGLSEKPTFKVYSKADPNFHVTIRDGRVVLAPADPSDRFQEWFKDEKYSTRVKDEEGCPAFSLVNKATGQAIKHSIGDTHPVELGPYNPDVLETSVLWTESKDLGDGYRAIRMVNNVHLNVDAFHGDKKSGGVRNGTTIVLWKWNKGDNQRWKIIRN
ncbi:hypothetical protein Tsubulata_017820 [Turnera subulata]|uniref:Ricin B lectin domain-containing protein n=1 Tax=Turnera subulata TaxID=218843 RepID=A0A9Q0EY01_9ROSI|nr:hypothetical protein Tsubulata_017820 [Turnera subulata]